MQIFWDEPKRLANLEKHGLDFADLENGFDFVNALEAPTYPSRTGRERKVLIGELNGALIVAAVMSPLGTEALSVASLRRATEKERRAYGR